MQNAKLPTFLIADPDVHSRNLLAEVLRTAGHHAILHARDGKELVERTVEHNPRVVFTTSRIAGISGLEFTRLIRAGYKDVPRTLGIIVMTDTPTRAFLAAAQQSGADEMLARPFSSRAVMIRVKSVLERPREFIDSTVYVGPCRRRRMEEDYQGPRRRFIDPIEGDHALAAWELESNRAIVRACVKKISQLAIDLSPDDRRKLREIYFATKEVENVADSLRDGMMGDAARSLGRYLSAVGASGHVDKEVLTTHIDAMHTLGLLGSQHYAERESLIKGLQDVVAKKLARARAA